MKLIVSFFVLLLLSTNIYSLDVEDIVSLSKANVGDDIILSVVAVSDEQINLSTQDIILLKKEGVSDKVIKVLIKKSKKAKKKQKSQKENNVVFREIKKEEKVEVKVDEPKKLVEVEEKRVDTREENSQDELKPFDQFFLSTYYSHQYGFPEKDYNSPSDILNRGLYYNSGYKHYPNARRVRERGHGYSFGRFGVNVSPYSIIVPRNQRYNKNYRHRNFGSHYRRNYRRGYGRNYSYRRGCK